MTLSIEQQLRNRALDVAKWAFERGWEACEAYHHGGSAGSDATPVAEPPNITINLSGELDMDQVDRLMVGLKTEMATTLKDTSSKLRL